MHILLVEDDAKVAYSIQKGLRESQIETALARTCRDALRCIETTRYDLLVLDLGLPDGDGIDVLRAARTQQSRIPVLILTARDQLEDRVRGLDEGADDYLAKPFAFAELLARIRALLRRAQSAQVHVLRVAELEIDLIKRTAVRGEKALDLTPRELDLLAYLVRAADQTVSRDMLARDVWKIASRAVSMDNVIDVHISHLRDKLDEGFDKKFLHTIRGVGYRFSSEPS